MKLKYIIIFLLFIPLFFAACAPSADNAYYSLQGPALVMFTTDN